MNRPCVPRIVVLTVILSSLVLLPRPGRSDASGQEPVLKVVRLAEEVPVEVLFADVRGTVELPSDAELNTPLGPEAWGDSDVRDLIE